MTNGPLRVHPENPRYVADRDGRPLLLTGSHTWTTVQDMGAGDPPPALDLEAFLDRLVDYGHSFTRLWTWEHARWAAHTLDDYHTDPMPFERTGPGEARDGGPRFDLERVDECFLDRLRRATRACAERGLYCSVMLFQGWSVEHKDFSHADGRNPWESHPLHRDNNVNGIDGDPDDTGQGLATHTLAVPAVTELQRAYVAYLVEALADVDNLVWEVGNEFAATPECLAWQNEMVAAVHAAEDRLGLDRRLTWITAMWPAVSELNEWLVGADAELVSPSAQRHYLGFGDDYIGDPPAADGARVMLVDTDHVWGVGGDALWVWRIFLRGHNPMFMDPWDTNYVRHSPYDPSARPAMGLARGLADELDLAALRPAGELASSGFALAARDGSAIAALEAEGARLAVDLRELTGSYEAEWRHTSVDSRIGVGAVEAGEIVELDPPYAGGAVLVLTRRDNR